MKDIVLQVTNLIVIGVLSIGKIGADSFNRYINL